MKEIEIYYGLTCPYCRTAINLIKKILEKNPEKFRFKQTLISSPGGIIKRYKLGIHAVPTIVIDGKIEFTGLPEEEELKEKLNLK